MMRVGPLTQPSLEVHLRSQVSLLSLISQDILGLIREACPALPREPQTTEVLVVLHFLSLLRPY